MRVLLAVVFDLALITQARASCECACVGGRMQPVCSSSIDLPPLCPPTLCALPPPSIAPLPEARLPPLGTSRCSQRQVLNPQTQQYEWRSLCQ